MLLLSAKARSAALLLALTAASPVASAAGPSLRGSRSRGRALDSGDAAPDSEDGGASRPFTAHLGEEGCALRERAGDPCDDPDSDCEAIIAFDCEDYATGYVYRVENDMVGISTGDGTFAFEHDAGAHLLDGNGEVTFVGDAAVNLQTGSVSFISGTFKRDAPAAHLSKVHVDPEPDMPIYDERNKGGIRDVPPAMEIPTFVEFQEVYASGDVQSDVEDAYGSADVPSEENVKVAGTAAVSQAGSQGSLDSIKGEYEDGEAVTLNFDLATAGDSGYAVGIFMRMADPQDGALAPIASLQLPPGLRSGSVTFSRQTMGMMNWPLDLYEWGTGYDAYVLDGNGAEVVGPAQFNILLDE